MLKTHEKCHEKKFECKICGKMFALQQSLKQHEELVHKNPKSFECEICGVKFSYKQALSKHRAAHDRNFKKPFQCHRCGFATTGNYDFKRHQNFHERQDVKLSAIKNPIKCEKCPAVLKSGTALSTHMRNIHPKRFFQCDLCAREFKTKHKVFRHMKVHTKH